ncbi:DUF6622 family protein [Hydrogenophaga sp. A37]|uniref:DUF6622 family protein n=1 Tax=Hydrogenophaga sp. A37 TaxID=1945864 RepID=UPI0009D32B08
MLIQLLLQQPTAALTIVQRTPVWVWGLFAGLVLLGLIQLRQREIGWRRAALPSLGLALFSAVSLGADLSASPSAGLALVVWLLAASAMLVVGSLRAPRAGTRYDATTGRFQLPGSVVPLLTILSIFFVKYGVGMELAMQPGLRHEATFALGLAAAYGAFSGLFAARPLTLWRLARARTTA